ncbi:unnamed protein product [Sphagnum compactum]
MASKPGVWSDWPWQSLGAWKYTLYAPFVVKAIHENFWGGLHWQLHGGGGDNWCVHMLMIAALRYLNGQLWMNLSRCYYVTSKYQIQTKGITFEQVDRESSWDDNILLHVIVGTMLHELLPGFTFTACKFWDPVGIVILLLLHVGPVECVYYWAHRALHHHYLFSRYHSHHHSSFVTEPVTGTVHPFAEHLLYLVIMYIPFAGTWLLGRGSMSMFYVYAIGFDFMNAMGHCNFEFMPACLLRAFPLLKYLVYTPSYHSLHHSRVHTNFALFMPIYDYLGGTVDASSDELHASVRRTKRKAEFVYLMHATELLSSFHLLPLGIPSFAAWPLNTSSQWYVWPLWPLTLPVMALLWLFGQAFVSDTYELSTLRTQTWVIPRFGFQYYLPFEKKRINKLIDRAIIEAEQEGARVICLGALNKSESLNGGGELFVNKHKHLRIRVVNGNTLTAAIILNTLPSNLKEVFLTGATSNLSQAIAIYLCRKGVRMLIQSQDLYESILTEVPMDYRQNLVQVTKYQDGQNCPVWVVGKWATPSDQKWAPPHTHFHQFVNPPIIESRPDCTYGKPAGVQLPKDIKGMRSCEMTMPRGVVHACHAGGLVHSLEGWMHHEVGTIDVDRIDVTWNAALKHGFKPI